MIDLHCHTTASDGALPPGAVVQVAARAGVRVLAITDHDTVDAVGEAARAAADLGVRIVAGVEISARIGPRELHVLGHFLDPADPALAGRLAAFRQGRASRGDAILERLRAHGVDLDPAELAVQAGGGSVGRPHVARLLVARGVARNMQDAFDRWLCEGRPGWVERPFPEAEEAIALIRGAGGVASLAHPALSGVCGPELERLAGLGLSAVEVDHPGQAEAVRRKLRVVAGSLGLLTTGGSDFHGEAGHPGMEGMDRDVFQAYEALARGRESS